VTVITHKGFPPYDRDDQALVGDFIANFADGHDVFITRGIRALEDIINSDDADYVMREIRRRFLADSTVTIELVGACTWARRFVDWEIQSSLRQPANGRRNGLLGVLLDRGATRGVLPNHLKVNVDSGYAKFMPCPTDPYALSSWIDDAYNARDERARLIRNGRDRFTYNRQCPA
jgi:Thoeris protein ThsB, TIR-like domain